MILIHRLRLAGALVLLLALLGFAGWMYATYWRPRLSDFPVQGVDVSAEDGPIDWWQAKKSGVEFVYARATSGSARRDPRFAETWRQVQEAGLQRGAVHVYSLCQRAADQAGNFVSTVARTDAQLGAALELDFQPECPARPDREIVIAEIDRFVAAIETHLGSKVILKTSKAFEAQYRVGEAVDRPLWAEGTFFAPGYLVRPWTMWQASSFRRIEGAARPVNWDVVAR